MEPNISPWRRAVCGDLTSCFDFSGGDAVPVRLPSVRAQAERAAALKGRTTPPTPETSSLPSQAPGDRPACPSPYRLACEESIVTGGRIRLVFVNAGPRAAVFHVYDRKALEAGPRRYTVEGGQRLEDVWDGADCDLQVMGPDGFHRRILGSGDALSARLEEGQGTATLILTGTGTARLTTAAGTRSAAVAGEARLPVAEYDANGRFDLAVEWDGARREFAGRVWNTL